MRNIISAVLFGAALGVFILTLFSPAWGSPRADIEAWQAANCAPATDLICTPAPLPDGVELEEEIACLAELIYYEARGEKIAGRMAVVDVVLLRLERRWRGATTVCEVARASYAGDGATRRMQFVGMAFEGQLKAEPRAWAAAKRLARFALAVHWRRLVEADHFWAGCDRLPVWVDRNKMEPVACIGAHWFWKHE